MNPFSYLKSRSVQIAAVAGLAVVCGIVIYRRYKYRKSLAADITSNDDPVALAKVKLKRLLRSDNVFCSDIDSVEETIDNLIMDGVEQLQVVADFDRTLTALSHDGKSVPSCHCVVEHCPHLPDWFKEKSDQMRDYYMAIEVDPHLTREEKYPFMIEWWEKAHELLVSCQIKLADIKEAVRISNLYLRGGSDWLLKCLHEQDIPLLVFSAGVGDVIEQLFIQRYKLYDNMHIISNWMEFNHEGFLIGFKGENIHIYNKNTHAVENSGYFDNIKHRHNVILLGDSLGDLDIAEGIPVQENLLTIGFLNHHVKDSLPEYKRRYDIVIAEDNTMSLLNALIENIVLSKS